jgi:hypothetical protein
MVETVVITLRLPKAICNRLQRFAPSKGRGKHNVPDYYVQVFRDYVDSAEFRLREAGTEIRELRFRSELIDQEVGLLKAQIRALGPSPTLKALLAKRADAGQ